MTGYATTKVAAEILDVLADSGPATDFWILGHSSAPDLGFVGRVLRDLAASGLIESQGGLWTLTGDRP